MTRVPRKPKIRFGKGGQYTALFSNVCTKSPDHFVLLLKFISKSGHPADHADLTVEKCRKLLKKENPNWKFQTEERKLSYDS